jgi:uridine phosphorylase
VFPEVCVWTLDKKTLMDAASRAGHARAFDVFFEQQRRACAQMLRVRGAEVPMARVAAREQSSSGMEGGAGLGLGRAAGVGGGLAAEGRGPRAAPRTLRCLGCPP